MPFSALLDARILAQFERLAQWFQRVFGQDCFWLARCALILYFVLGTVYFLEPEGSNTLSVLPPLFMIGFATVCVWLTVGVIEEDAAGDVLSGLSNNEKISGRRYRVFAFFVALIATPVMMLFGRSSVAQLIMTTPVGEAVLSCWFWLYVAALYFAACDPLPPGRSKARAVWERVRATALGTGVRELVPEPSQL